MLFEVGLESLILFCKVGLSSLTYKYHRYISYVP